VTPDPLISRYSKIVVKSLRNGKVIPFLGAGANMCGRPDGVDWQEGTYPPSGAELTDYLADAYEYPENDGDLLRVSQWVKLTNNEGILFDDLHNVFDHPYAPNELHTFLAELPKVLRDQNPKVEQCGQLILTTNYDDVLERAFAKADEAVDVVFYETRQDAQHFVHLTPDGERVPIDEPGTYRKFALEERSVILKIHGQVDRGDAGNDTFVITDDDYIDYLAGAGALNLIPAYLTSRLRGYDLLFLGYSLRDWNLRVILRQIRADQGIKRGGWSIQLNPSELDKEFWKPQGIAVIDARLEDWVGGMREQFQ